MIQKYQTLTLSISPHPIIKNLQLKYLIKRKKGKRLVDKSDMRQQHKQQKIELKIKQNKETKLQAFDLSYFHGSCLKQEK